MLLPDSSIVPGFLRRKQPSDNSTLLLLQCTNRLKSSKDFALCATAPAASWPEADVPTQQRPDVKRNPQLLMQQALHSSMVKQLLHLLACNLLNTLGGQHGLGMGEDTLPSYSRRLTQTLKL